MKHEEIKVEYIPLDCIEQNTGQIPGLPTNPRSWTHAEVERLAASLKDTPRLLTRRALIVYDYEGRYVILGGNMRFDALRLLGETEAPCNVYPADADLAELKAVVIKDNGSFGSWDWDELANSFDDLDLPEMGVPVWDTTPQETQDDDQPEAPTEVPAEDVDVDDVRGLKMSLVFSQPEFVFVTARLSAIDANKETALLRLLGYEDNGDSADNFDDYADQ